MAVPNESTGQQWLGHWTKACQKKSTFLIDGFIEACFMFHSFWHEFYLYKISYFPSLDFGMILKNDELQYMMFQMASWTKHQSESVWISFWCFVSGYVATLPGEFAPSRGSLPWHSATRPDRTVLVERMSTGWVAWVIWLVFLST